MDTASHASLTAPPAAKPHRCRTCDRLVAATLAPLAPDLKLPTDSYGRCPTCTLWDATVCPCCNVHVYAYERDGEGRCEDCASVAASKEAA